MSVCFLSTVVFHTLQDSCNRKSNQQNLGTIKSSNLCTEIIEYTSPTETAVCNLASIALPRYVREKVYTFSAHEDCVWPYCNTPRLYGWTCLNPLSILCRGCLLSHSLLNLLEAWVLKIDILTLINLLRFVHIIFFCIVT